MVTQQRKVSREALQAVAEALYPVVLACASPEKHRMMHSEAQSSCELQETWAFE